MTVSNEAPARLHLAFERWCTSGRRQSPTTWRCATWKKWIGDDRLPTTPTIDRGDAEVAARAATDSDEQAIRAFVTAMAWGYGRVGYGAWRTRRILDHSGDAAGPRLRAVAEAAHHGPEAAFAAMAAAPLPYLGPAFGTKYIYFCTAAVRDQHDGRTAPVLDQVVRRWLARHAGLRLAGTWSTRQYGLYLDRLESWGTLLGIPSDQVEELVFLDQRASDGGYRSADLTVESDPHGEALVALDDLRTAVAVLDPFTSDAAEDPLQQIRQLIDTAVTRS
ncbi:hypothetical protein SAMN05216207_101550 [Pseudonocardia ammonioxydans]|uniref:Uncharacterized protein n=1 Tax=Pseudonocardia ammonioxydans TaxID=260086 RepID=A0A1I4ZG89_PSUAM|nr:hypothetical protein [Pseudonocardia ammonioxydans]SFN48920.1 hypothetical protein SAMN05216207_101550 [Pseudonocardia ammonioxydans]